MCLGHNACCGVERIVALLSLRAVLCRFVMPFFVCAVHLVIIVQELLFSLLLEDVLTVQCCLRCMSVMVVAQRHHMQLFSCCVPPEQLQEFFQRPVKGSEGLQIEFLWSAC